MGNEQEAVKTMEANGSQLPVSQETKFGLSVIRTGKDKRAFDKWAQYREEESSIDLWHDHYLSSGYIGIICGKISGNLEVLDFDLKNDPEKTIYDEFVKLVPEELISRLVCQSTINGGYHLIYRCSEKVDGNL